MELWEFTICVKEYSKMQLEEIRRDTENSWKTANFTGAAFCGKLKKLDYYIKQKEVINSPKVSKDEFERKLAEAERRMKS